MANLPIKYLRYANDSKANIDILNTNLKQLDWAINNARLDGKNISASYVGTLELNASQIIAGTIDANTITISNLTVGDNVVFGPNAIVGWSQVDKTLANPFDIGAMSINPLQPTTIGSNWIYTGELTAQQLYSVNGLIMGQNGSITWNGVDVVNAATVKARADSWLPTPSQINAVYKSQTEVFNTLTNNGANPGLYMSGGQMYINASYIKTGTIDADRIDVNSLLVNKIYSSAGLTGWSVGINGLAGDLSIFSPSGVLGFQIRNDMNAWNLYAGGDNFLGYNVEEDKTYPKGNWDFTACTNITFPTGVGVTALFG